MAERFIGADRSGSFGNPKDHLYFAATRYSRRRQVRWIIRVSRGRVKELRGEVADWQEKITAIMTFRAINEIFHPGYSIQIHRDFQGRQQKKVRGYLKRLFGVVNRGKGLWANPPVAFLPEKFSRLIKDADKKAGMARQKKITPNEVDPAIGDLLQILEYARRRGIV